MGANPSYGMPAPMTMPYDPGMGGYGGLPAVPQWGSYLELEATGLNNEAYGQGKVFVPMWETQNSLNFLDLRVLGNDQQAAEGNIGVAYREIAPSGLIYGINAFYDIRNTESDNTFHQGTLGLEMLSVNWGLRANGYLPELNAKAAPQFNTATLQGGNIVVNQGLEAAYAGVDLEYEQKLFGNGGGYGGCGECGGLYGGPQLEVWLAAGGFYFDAGQDNFEHIAGPSTRLEMRLLDLPSLGPDSRLVLSASYKYDQVRDSTYGGSINIRIPFGPQRVTRGYSLAGINRRMVAPIERDDDIVTNAGAFGANEVAQYRDGRTIAGVSTIDAKTTNPVTTFNSVAANSVIVVDGSQGDITTNGTFSMKNGQTALGGGSSLEVQGASSGSVANFVASGTRPTINNSTTNMDTFNLGTTSNANIIGIDMTGGLNGIFGNGNQNFLISDVMVSKASRDGISISGNSDGTVTNSLAMNNGLDGFSFDTMSGTVSDNTAAGNTRVGFFFRDASGTVSGNAATGNSLRGFFFRTVSGKVNGNTASGNQEFGYHFLGTVSGNVQNNVADNNGLNMNGNDDGFFFNSGLTGNVSGNSSSNNGNAGFGFTSIDTGAKVTSNIAESNTDSGFVFNLNGGDFSMNTANNNTAMGYNEFSGTPSGTASNNTGSGNTGGGNTFSLP